MPVTALYAALLAPLFLALSARVIMLRRAARVSMGDGGDKELLRRMRVHGNFAEYAPFALLLIGLAESLHTRAWLLHGLGMALVAGRYSHAWGLSQPIMRLRVGGMVTTLTVIALAAACCLWGVIAGA